MIQTATEYPPVVVEPARGGARAHVWLFRDKRVTEDGDGTEVIEYDSVDGTVDSIPDAAEIEADFETWWASFEQAAKTDRELLEETMEAALAARAQADFTALMTGTEVG